jgi:hypothetical protein
MLLYYLGNWAPFRIDALGIVTLLGAEQIDLAVGRLARNRFTGCLPVLAAFKIAGNDIVQPIPGFVLYNVTDGIMATDIVGWFSRWLQSQELTFSSTTLHISTKERPTKRLQLDALRTYALALFTMCPLLVLAILLGDGWGIANVISMIISIIVRHIVEQNRGAIDRAALKAMNTSTDQVKILVTLPTGEVVSIKVSRGIVLDCLLTNPRPPNPRFYTFTRAVGWLGFGLHVVSLGMADLLNQLLAVAVLLGSSAMVAWRVGDDETQIGRRLCIKRSDHPLPDFRAAAMARLNPSPSEEDSLLAWGLFPHRSNTNWWRKFRACQAEADLQPFRKWDKILADSTGDAQAGVVISGRSTGFTSVSGQSSTEEQTEKKAQDSMV